MYRVHYHVICNCEAGGQAEQSGGNGVRGTGGGGDGNVGGVTTSAVLPEKERMAARDQAAASVEEHLQVKPAFKRIIIFFVFAQDRS